MDNANFLADELHNSGFQTKVVTSNSVMVSLNRKVDSLEVRVALDRIVEVEFNLTTTSNGVLVSW